MSWRDDAACAHAYDPEAFVKPASNGRSAPRDWDLEAKEWCDVCPVKAECLRDALEQGDEWTVRGGLNPDERHALYGRKRAPVHEMDHGTTRGYRNHLTRMEEPCRACKQAKAVYDAERARKASA